MWKETTAPFQDSYSTPVKRLQQKMIEYLHFIFQCAMDMMLGATAYYLYSYLKMAEGIIDELISEESYESLESDVKQQKLIKCILTGNSKQYLGKAYTEE